MMATPHPTPDEQTNCSSQQSASDGVQALFESHYDDMVRLAFVLLRNQADAEETVQDAFLDLQARWRTVLNPPGYLRTSVVNGARRRMSRSANRRQIIQARLAPQRVDGEPANEYLVDILDALPEQHRTAIVLAYYLGLPANEIAEVMGCRPGTAKSLIHRGLKRLRKELADHA
ncbi:MAG: sigma-70 family RNA polymerase sigma factor [Actinomycetota bacterium]